SSRCVSRPIAIRTNGAAPASSSNRLAMVMAVSDAALVASHHLLLHRVQVRVELLDATEDRGVGDLDDLEHLPHLGLRVQQRGLAALRADGLLGPEDRAQPRARDVLE